MESINTNYIELDLSDYALSLIENGFSILPCWGNNTKTEELKKTPVMSSWAEFQRIIMTKEKFLENYRPGNWIGMIAGEVSGNLECIDIENGFGDAAEILKEYTQIPDVKEIIERCGLVIESTYRGGRHLIYRCESPVGKKSDLAFRIDKDGKKKLLIETRSQGQYFVCSPSPGYDLLYPEDGFMQMGVITKDERNFLLEMARSFNEVVEPFYYHQFTQQKIVDKAYHSQRRPGDAYNESAEAIEEAKGMLRANGWQESTRKGWIRPGKDKGISATFGYVAPNVFYVFSSNADPFAAGKAYKPFDIFTLLNFGSDWKTAAKVLKERGYGSPSVNQIPVEDYLRNVIRKTKPGESIEDKDRQWLIQKNGFTEQQADDAIQKAIAKFGGMQGQDFMKTEIERVMNYIQTVYTVRYNIIKNELLIWKKGDENHISRTLKVEDIYIDLLKNQYKVKKGDLETIMDSQFVERFHEIYEYLTALTPYNAAKEPDYIGEYASYFILEDPKQQEFWTSMLRKHLVRAIRCALDGKENRFVPVLIGGQEAGKTNYIRNLCPFNDYYIETNPLEMTPKDAQIAIARNFFWNIDDLDGFTKRDISKLKALISKSFDNVRDHYERRAKRVDRIVSFFGTSNLDNFLSDETGNSRFICVKGRIRSWDYNNFNTGVVEVSVERIWAQAYSLYLDKNFNPELTAEEKNIRDEINGNFEVENFVDSLITEHFSPATENDLNFWSYSRIYAFLLDKVKNMKELSSTSIITSFRRLNRDLASKGQPTYIKGRKGNSRGFFIKASSAEAFFNQQPLNPTDEMPF